MLSSDLKNQLAQYLELLENKLTLRVSLDDSDDSKEMKEFLEEVVSLSDKLTLEEGDLNLSPSFSLDREDGPSGVVFAGVPMGHEFESFVLALLQVGGRQPKIDQELIDKIKKIEQDLHFETFVSLTCHNCPEVVQALNIMAVLNPKISNTMIEGGTFQSLVEEKSIMAVPTVYLDGQELFGGKRSLEEILDMILGEDSRESLADKGVYDTLVIGGGPAAMSAAIYSVRKGIRTGLLADKFGGQVNDTLEINNILGIQETEGPKFMAEAKAHVESYPVEVLEGYKATGIDRKDDLVEVSLDNGDVLKAKTIVIATGAGWRLIGIPGEIEFKNKGVAYCVHCDGPLFKDKPVAVIGGGNSGVESALDLAGIAKEVHLIQFDDRLTADQVLQDRLKELDNVKVYLNANTQALLGDGKVEQVVFKDRQSGEETSIDIAGCFIQVGLVPHTEWLGSSLELNKRGEIIIDNQGLTSVEGVYAAGDCTDVVYKQIIIAAGSGATASLGAYNYLLRQGRV